MPSTLDKRKAELLEVQIDQARRGVATPTAPVVDLAKERSLDRLAFSNSEDKKNSLERYKTELANPMSLLSGQEQRMELFEDLKQKRAMQPGAVRAQNAASAYHEGAGMNQASAGALSQAKADTQNMLNPVYGRMSNQDQARVLFERPPVGNPNQLDSNIASPSTVGLSAVDTLAAQANQNNESAEFDTSQYTDNDFAAPSQYSSNDLFEPPAKALISGIDTIGNTADYLGRSMSSARKNFKRSKFNVLAAPAYEQRPY